MKRFCYLNGEIVLEEEACVSVNDVGLLRGFAVFEFLKTVNGKPFLLSEHLARLVNSAKDFNMKLPVKQDEIEKIVEELREKNEFEEATFKLVLTGGESEDGMTCNFESPTFFVLMRELPKIPAEIFIDGVKLIAHEHKRENSSSKSTSYATMLKLQKKKEKEGAFEILYTYRGNVLEGASSSFFLVSDGNLVTAKEGILNGTTRALIIDLAKKAGLEVDEREVKIAEIEMADEAFTTATLRGVVPVVQIDDQKIGDGKVGRVTRRLIDEYRNYLART